MEHSPKRASSRVTDALAGVAPFSALDEGSRDRMAQSCRVLSLDAHEVLLRDGQIPTNVYILMEGCLTRSFVTLEGKGVILNHTRPVTAFCCAAAVDGSAHIGTVEAWEPSTVVAVPIAAVARALEESPAFAVAVARNLARSSVRQTETIRELMFPVPVRLARLLCRRAEGDGAAELDMHEPRRPRRDARDGARDALARPGGSEVPRHGRGFGEARPRARRGGAAQLRAAVAARRGRVGDCAKRKRAPRGAPFGWVLLRPSAEPYASTPSIANASSTRSSALSRQSLVSAELCAPSEFSTNTKSQ